MLRAIALDSAHSSQEREWAELRSNPLKVRNKLNKIMTKLQILAAEIETDMNDLMIGVEEGGSTKEDMEGALIMISDKIKEWSKEANRIMDEAEAVDGKEKNITQDT